jgi:tRNA-dihydrouridine synthase
MIGRAALGNPWLIREVAASMRGETAPPAPSVAERVDFARSHFDAMIERYGEKSGVLQMRKHLGWYVKGVEGAAALRERINQEPSADPVRLLLAEARTRPLAAEGVSEGLSAAAM